MEKKAAQKDVAVAELPYREVQAELKALGLNAKGSAEVLRERLTEARTQQAGASGAENGDAGQEEEKQPAKSPPAAPATSRKTRSRKEEPGAPKRETYEVTTEVKAGGSRQRGSRADALLSASKEAFPDENVSVKPVSQAELTPHLTPLDKARRLARKSASELHRSANKLQEELHRGATKFQEELQQRKLTWLLPALAALLLAVLLASQWRHSAYWQRQMSAQVESLQRNVHSLYEVSSLQAAALGDNLHYGYVRVQDRVSSGAARLSGNAQALWDSSSEYASDAYGRALHYIPSTKKLRALMPTTACSARLNSTQLDPIFPSEAAWEGLRGSLHDAWAGLKHDPLKGTGVLLAGANSDVLQTAALALKNAVPDDCQHCWLHLQGDKLAAGGPDAAGELQATLVAHLRACPYAIVHIQAVNKVHADALPVLLVALSEQGNLYWDGKQVPSNKGIYIGSTVIPLTLLEETDEANFAAAVKKDLVFQLEMMANPQQMLVPEAFRRRWDYVAPIRKSS